MKYYYNVTVRDAEGSQSIKGVVSQAVDGNDPSIQAIGGALTAAGEGSVLMTCVLVGPVDVDTTIA